MTRIVAGSVGGRRIEVPQRGTRPTSDRVREALFSALDSEIELSGTRVLDLYAGSGALGLEALSRGAAYAMFVEADRKAAGLVRRNAAALGFTAVRVEQAKAETVLAKPAERPFEVVLADPPYDVESATLARTLKALADGGWVMSESIVIVERAVRSGRPEWPEGWEAFREKRYGDTALHWASTDLPFRA